MRDTFQCRWVIIVSIFSLLLAACAGPAEPQVVKETVVVKEEVVVKETVEVEVTTVVEVVVTATPEPASEEEEATEAEEEPAAEGDEAYMTVLGERLPEDAAPYDMQVFTEGCDITGNHITFDFQVSVYQRFCLSDLFQDQLVNLDKDFNTIPASAESWEVSEDGLTWTFHIKPGLEWSDGTPLTAHDWVATYQLIATPEHAWDFAWFYAGVIKNWDEIIAGELDPSELGVTAVDDLTLQFTTVNPWPALPAMMQFSFVLQKAALEEHGPLYNSSVETSVSAGLTSLRFWNRASGSNWSPTLTTKASAHPAYSA